MPKSNLPNTSKFQNMLQMGVFVYLGKHSCIHIASYNKCNILSYNIGEHLLHRLYISECVKNLG